MNMRRILAAMCLCLAVTMVEAQESGLTPSSARSIGAGEVTGTVRTSTYYQVSVEKDGLVEVELTPVSGEVDLAVVHFSGSPAIESRKEGTAAEAIALRASQGDRFLIRVISPFGRPADFKLSVRFGSVAPMGPAAAASPSTQVMLPTSSADGKSPASAVELPLGGLVAVESLGTRHFRLRVPAGYVLDAALYPVYGDANLEVVMVGEQGVSRAGSRRRGQLAERVYLPIRRTGEVIIGVSVGSSADDLLRYGLVVRLREMGIGAMESRPEPSDEQAVAAAFAGRLVGHGVPGWGDAAAPGRDQTSRVLILR